MSDGGPQELVLADALATLAVNCLQAVPPGVPVAGALVAVTWPSASGADTTMSYVTHSRLASPDSQVLRTIAAAILERAGTADTEPDPTA